MTSDKVVNGQSVKYMPGGTAYYFSCALSNLPVNYLLATAVGKAEMHYIDDLKAMGIEVIVQPSQHTVFFENIYADDLNLRRQNVLQLSDSFTVSAFEQINAQVFHLGPLLAGDIPIQLIKELAGKAQVSLDAQGYLRRVVNKKVYATDWADKKEALAYVDILKADVAELSVLSGTNNVQDGARILADWGVNEIVITDGNRGSQIYNDGIFYNIPAYVPEVIADTTGCGDTYMAAYLYQRVTGAPIQEAGEFAAGMSGLKTKTHGPFTGTVEDIAAFLAKTKTV